MTAKKKPSKPVRSRLRPGDTATITPARPGAVNLVPEYIHIQLHHSTAAQIVTLLETESSRLYDLIEIEAFRDLPFVVDYEIRCMAEEFSLIAGQIEKALDPHHEVP